MKTILITGAAGDVGTHLRRELAGKYKIIASDLRDLKEKFKGQSFKRADISKMSDALKITKGVDAVIHLGGYSVEGPWEGILNANIVGCYNLFEAAHRKRVKRIVFASSNHAVGFYPRRRRIGPDHRVRPDSRYGVSKAFGEALGSLYASKHGMRVTNIRIGNFADRPVDVRRLSIWISPQDLAQLIRIGLEHPDIRCEIFFGASDNARGWWDNADAFRFGYRPTGVAEDHREAAFAWQAKLKPDRIADWYEGGPFCSDEYDGDEDLWLR